MFNYHKMAITVPSVTPMDLKNIFTSQFKKELLSASEENKFGIENLKKIESFKANLIKEVWVIASNWKKGVKPNGWIVFRFFDDVFDFAKIMRKQEELAKEFNDLTPEELVELDNTFADALKIENVDMEEFIERTNFMIGVNADYIAYLSTLKK